MQRDITVERNRLNHFLLLGTINHTAFLVIIFFIYALAGFKSSGDQLGGLMMMYALTLFMPQVVFGIFILGTVTNSLSKNKSIERDRKRFYLYVLTLALALITFFTF